MVIKPYKDEPYIVYQFPRGSGKSYLCYAWHEQYAQYIEKLWQDFKLKYFYIANHKKIMVDTTLIRKWQLQKLVKKGKFITIKDIETNLLTGNIKVAETPFYMQEMVKQYLEWKEDKNSVLNTMIH